MIDALGQGEHDNHVHLCPNYVLSRPYRAKDQSACLAIFDSNLPRFFAPEERDEYSDHLDMVGATDCPYLVLTDRDAVIACGGLSIEAELRRASLSWGMVDGRYHRCGLGRRLLQERLALARANPGIDEVILNTSQHSQGFFARFGFQPVRIKPDGLAAGLDRWDMRLCLRA